MKNLSYLISESPYRHTLSAAVLKLQEQGTLAQMKRRWWKEKDGGGACTVILIKY